MSHALTQSAVVCVVLLLAHNLYTNITSLLLFLFVLMPLSFSPLPTTFVQLCDGDCPLNRKEGDVCGEWMAEHL